ncbi:tyrosine-type recombinase/integrase [Enterococcus alishanensis]
MASVKQQANGKWRFRMRYKENGKFKEVSRSGFRTKRDAQAAANDIERQHRNGVSISGGNILVEDYLPDWLETFKKPHVKQSTYLRLERAIRLHILPTFGLMKLNEITRKDVVKWVNHLSEEKNQLKSTVRSNLLVLRDALETATIELDFLEKNVASGIKIPGKESSDKVKFFTRDELDQLLTFLSTYQLGKYGHSIQYYALFTLLSHTGLRLGEALALEWSDINFETKMLSISKNLAYDDHNNAVITTPKSESSKRIIKMDAITVDVLKRHKVNKNECILKYPSYLAPKNINQIFSNENGNYLRHSVVRDFFAVSCKRAKVPVLSPHALRHSHAVHLLESGATLKYVSSRLGHKTISITADTYLHITQKIENDALDLYEKYI